MTFADRLRTAREACGFPQVYAAQHANMTSMQWSNMECGRNSLDQTLRQAQVRVQTLQDRIKAIAGAVNTTPEHLLGIESPHVDSEGHPESG